MPLETTAILKIGGGLAVAGGATGLGIVYKDTIFGIFYSNAYLIVKATDASSQPAVDDLKHGKDKNYECKIESVEKAVDCEIVEVKFHDTNKSVDIATLNSLQANEAIKRTVFSTSATDKYFKLKIDKSHLSNIKITDNTPKTIDLVLKNAADADKTKKYAKLTPEFQVVDGFVTTKSKDLLVAVQVPAGTSPNADTFTNYKCSSGDVIATPLACDLHKFTSDNFSNNVDLKTVNFSSMNASKITQASDVTNDKLKIVKVANVTSDKLNKYWKNQTIKFSSTTANTKAWDFTVISRLYGDASSPSKGIFILEK